MSRPLLIAVVLVLNCVMHVLSAPAEQPRSYALLPAPERAALPDWAKPGRMRYARCDGGPIEVCKAFLSGWPQIHQPDAILPCVTEYGDHTIEMLKQAKINWIWVTWSVGFSRESEAVQRRLVRPFVAKCHQAGIHVSAYLSLTNMFIEDMNRHVPASRNWMQLEADGTPRPYGAAKYEGKPTRIIACLNNPEWLAYCRDRLAERVAELSGGLEIDPSRLAQEVAFLAERSDITEELVRIKSHLNQFREMLDRPEPMGRKMEFLLQEFNREANTIGSKANDAGISYLTVEIKSELEKMREQVQNVE